MRKYKKFVICSDIHGSHMHKPTVKALLKFVKEQQPHRIVIAGDVWDFGALRKGAGNGRTEKGQSLSEDWKLGVWFFKSMRDAAPKAEITFMRGNHDERLWDLFADENDGIKRDYAERGIQEVEALMAELKLDMFPYCKRKGVVKLGPLTVCHGFSGGLSAARVHASAYQSVAFGHTHAKGAYRFPALHQAIGINIGCCCELDLGYNRNQVGTLRQEHSWAYGIYNDSSFFYHLADEAPDGKFITPLF